MKIHELHESTVSRLIEQALFEDLGFGDITTESIIPEDTLATAHILSNDAGVIAGLEVAGLVFRYIDMQITFSPLIREGESVKAGQTIAHIHGPLRGIVQGKQTALNFLMRMSGIASVTRRYVDKIKGTEARIVGSRYTIPTIRMIDHFAFKAGGGFVRSFGIDEEIVITADHARAAGDFADAIEKAFHYLTREKIERPVSVEVRTFDELRDIIDYADRLNRIILTGFPAAVIPQAVDAIDEKTKIEVQGGFALQNVREIADAGVQYINIPQATHSPDAVSFTFRVVL
jgi:nicotinate-nucleotide pyrophosphorylase (carboxylating)